MYIAVRLHFHALPEIRPYGAAFRNGWVQHDSAPVRVDGNRCAHIDAPPGFKANVKPLGTMNCGLALAA